MKLRKGKVLELSKDAGKTPLKKPPDGQGIGKEKLQYRDIKVMATGTEMCFEYSGLAKEQTTIAVLMNKLKPNLRLFPNETVDVWWIKDSVSLEYIDNDTECEDFWYNGVVDDKGWLILSMQVRNKVEMNDSGTISVVEEISMPHRYLTPRKSPVVKTRISKSQMGSTRRSPRLAANSGMTECSTSRKKIDFIDIEDGEAYVPEDPQPTQASVVNNSDGMFDHDYWAEVCARASTVEESYMNSQQYMMSLWYNLVT
ncbi:hypothetical protein MKW98_015639 [Papaver atlanticum]|uniref:Uncharacterized protein n=1 Tax=Papaver atlanticum TaxID=357466 RepID=A0AAD4S664_9MAGN|nr:hypothetical protein MKW98_015639 [Papaver atlanticum]